jgi:hypothetical protein
MSLVGSLEKRSRPFLIAGILVIVAVVGTADCAPQVRVIYIQ